MSVITTSNISELKEKTAIVCLLMYLDLYDSAGNNVKYYFNNANNDLYVNSQKYTTMPFDITDFDTGSGMVANDVEITFDNVGLFPAGIFLNRDQRGNSIEIGIGAFDSNMQMLGTSTLWNGFITNYSITEQTAQIVVSHEFIFWRKHTLKKYTYDNFPNLKDIDERQIWWGRSPQ